MNITNEKGRPISLPALCRLADEACPAALWAQHVGIFSEFTGEWAHALTGSEWVTPATHSIFALAGENWDGPNWDRPYWEALPKDAISIALARVAGEEAARVARHAILDAAEAAREVLRVAKAAAAEAAWEAGAPARAVAAAAEAAFAEFRPLANVPNANYIMVYGHSASITLGGEKIGYVNASAETDDLGPGEKNYAAWGISNNVTGFSGFTVITADEAAIRRLGAVAQAALLAERRAEHFVGCAHRKAAIRAEVAAIREGDWYAEKSAGVVALRICRTLIASRTAAAIAEKAAAEMARALSAIAAGGRELRRFESRDLDAQAMVSEFRDRPASAGPLVMSHGTAKAIAPFGHNPFAALKL